MVCVRSLRVLLLLLVGDTAVSKSSRARTDARATGRFSFLFFPPIGELAIQFDRILVKCLDGT